MRVLSETEIEELLAKMDMYNRELLSEQQKWQLALGSEVVSPSAVNLQSIDRIIEHANDELLRREQAAQDAADTPKAKRAAGILHNVISAAKSTFGKGASSDAVTSPVVCTDTSTSSASRSACCIETPVRFTEMPTSRVDSWAGRDDEPLATDVSVVIAEEVKPDVNSYVEPEAVAEAPLVASNAPLPQLQTEPPVAIVFSNDETASSCNAPQIDSIETGTMAADIATESGVTASDDIEATPPLSPAKPPHAYDQEATNGVSEAADVDSSNAIPVAAAEECVQMPVSPTLATEPSSPVPSTVVEEEAVSTKVALESSPIGSDVLDIPKTETVESPSVAPTAPAAIPRTSDSSKQAPKLPGMPRSQTAVPVDDPLAEVRARLKKKQSSSALPTANSGSVAAARAAILGTAESKPDAPALPGRVAPKTPVKSVRNLVAMFEQS
ncbi:hypothetical protein LPJ60_006209 [Coemansia sp. RSA 2675]|nr:hypothetical protein LPJ60_006209 [Coemansia sp. RSA 2675]